MNMKRCCLAILLTLAWFLTVCAWAADKPVQNREEELAGDQETSQPSQPATGPVVKEPERQPAGSDKARPMLKLPEVVVKGDRDYRVTAERKDLLSMDPMRGTKETPDDLAKVAMPGLEDQKETPSSETVTAKNYLLSLEGGLGSNHWSEGRLVAGLQMPGLNAVLRSDYDATDHPMAFGITPYDQKGTANLDLGITAVPGVRFSVGAGGKLESDRQPENLTLGWGDWLVRSSGSLELGAEFNLSPPSKLKLQADAISFNQHGAPEPDAPVMNSHSVGVKVNWEHNLRDLVKSDMDILADLSYTGAETTLDSASQSLKTQENLKTLAVTARFRPVSILMADLGVQVDDFQGITDKSTSSVLGRLSLALPTESTVYASLDGGLNWEPSSEWVFNQPRQSVTWLPKAEEIKSNFKAGLRQRLGEAVSLDAAWFRRDAAETPVWVDGNKDGLFNLINLPRTRQQGWEAEMEINYSQRISQKISYIYRSIESIDGLVQPNLPLQEAKTELRIEFPGVMTSLGYRYLGERYGDPSETKPSLVPAHLVSALMDIKLASNWNIYAKLDNLLNTSWG
jgi:hypothetical protein